MPPGAAQISNSLMEEKGGKKSIHPLGRTVTALAAGVGSKMTIATGMPPTQSPLYTHSVTAIV